MVAGELVIHNRFEFQQNIYIYIYIYIYRRIVFVHFLQDHALNTKPRDAIFVMHTHITPRNDIGFVSLTFKVKGGHGS